MDTTYSFKFIDGELNRQLIGLLETARVEHTVDKEDVVHYSSADEELIGNKLIPSIRVKVFPTWQIISCPPDWVERYKVYMIRHDVPFAEELIDGRLCYLIPRKYRPHSWQLEESGDRVNLHPIRKRYDSDLVKRLCQILIEQRRGKTLAVEVLRDLDTGYLDDSTYSRLSRWCNPARPEPDAQPIAEKISRELFGLVISRVA